MTSTVPHTIHDNARRRQRIVLFNYADSMHGHTPTPCEDGVSVSIGGFVMGDILSWKGGVTVAAVDKDLNIIQSWVMR